MSFNVQLYIRTYPAYSHVKLSVSHRKPSEKLVSFTLSSTDRSSRQSLLGQPDEKHRGYEYCVIARLPRNKREPVTMTLFLSLSLSLSFSLGMVLLE